MYEVLTQFLAGIEEYRGSEDFSMTLELDIKTFLNIKIHCNSFEQDEKVDLYEELSNFKYNSSFGNLTIKPEPSSVRRVLENIMFNDK